MRKQKSFLVYHLMEREWGGLMESIFFTDMGFFAIDVRICTEKMKYDLFFGFSG